MVQNLTCSVCGVALQLVGKFAVCPEHGVVEAASGSAGGTPAPEGDLATLVLDRFPFAVAYGYRGVLHPYNAATAIKNAIYTGAWSLARASADAPLERLVRRALRIWQVPSPLEFGFRAVLPAPARRHRSCRRTWHVLDHGSTVLVAPRASKTRTTSLSIALWRTSAPRSNGSKTLLLSSLGVHAEGTGFFAAGNRGDAWVRLPVALTPSIRPDSVVTASTPT